MSEPIEIERDEEMLGQLAELDLALAKLVYSRAAAAEDAGEMADLGRTYQRLARSLRQTIALRDRLRRARRQEARANPPPKPPRDPVRIARRKVELREAVRRVIFTETEGEQQDYLWELLDDRLDEVLPDDWGLEPLDDQVTCLCAELDLPLEAAARWRELPDIVYGDQASPAGASPAQAAAPPPGRPPAAPEWRSSA